MEESFCNANNHTSVSCCSVTQSYLAFCDPWTAARQPSLSFTISQSLLKLVSTESVVPSNHAILCYPRLLLPSIFPSIRWPKYWISASASVLPMNTQDWSSSGWTGWSLLAVQGTLKSLLQHHSSKASILQHSAFFIVQLSYPYMTTGKTIALTRRMLVNKVMSLFFNMLSRLVITFFPKSKRL